jgi:hypothetical protein
VLIVDHELGLGQERDEAVADAELHRRRTAIVRAATAPAVEREAGSVELADSTDGGADGDPLRAERAHERVVDVDVHDALRALRKCRQRCIPIRLRRLLPHAGSVAAAWLCCQARPLR